MLALNWVFALRETCECILGLHRRNVSLSGAKSVYIDIESIDSFRRVLLELRPDVVIHTTALTSVEVCEKEPQLAFHINAELAENVALACAAEKIKLVHISTDHLFAGNNAFSTELDNVQPINHYARTKADGEQLVLAAHPESLVIRTNFFGWGTTYRQSFSDLIIKSLRDGKPLSLFEDVYYTPVHAGVLAETIHELVSVNACGIFNVVSDERLSKFDFGKRIAEVFDLDSSLLTKSELREMTNLVQRPLDMSLSNRKVCDVLQHQIGSVSDHIHALKVQEKNGVIQEIQNL